MQGDVLYPLRQLRNVFPALYEYEVTKYEGREHLMSEWIPQLECVWSDVLHLSVLHPRRITQALAEAGIDRTFRFFEIPTERIEPTRAVIYRYEQTDPRDKYSDENVVAFTPDTLEQWAEVPAAAKQYYATQASVGKPVLLFHRCPHVLYRGALDVSDCAIIET